DFERRFTQEAQALVALEHPHIVPIYHYGMVGDGSAYIAMRLMRESLDARLAQGQLTSQQVTDIALQLIEGLGYAHKKGVLHQDIKPENILFDEAGSACLADFGLARVTDQSVDTHRANFVVETAMYIAPEQIRSSYTDPRADIYSLGVVMYQMLTGSLPFEAENLTIDALLHKIESEEPVSPRKLNAEVAPELERVVLRAIRKEPRERFFDVGEMAQALEAVPGTRSRVRRPPPLATLPTQYKSTSARRLRLRIAAAVVVVGVFILALLVVNILRQNVPPQTATIETALRGSVLDVVPSAQEVTRAQRVLGDDGFIAYIACAQDSEFQSVRAREMSDYAQADGLAYRSYDSANDDYKQLTLIEQARLEGAKAIILCPLSPNFLSDSLNSVKRAGIPLVLTHSLSESYGGVMLAEDDHQIGLCVGRFIGKTLAAQKNSSPKIVILDAPEYPFSDQRVQGFLDGVAQSFPQVQVVHRYATGADQAASQVAIAKLISGDQKIDAIFSVTDTGAYGAIAALSAAQIAPDSVVIASVNAESKALDQIAHNNYLRASVDVGLDAGSRGAFNAAVKLLGGGTLPQILTLPSENLITRDIIMGQSPSS
ncbi:MAG: substrate-binding domain-containing protein, partial [Chloroflexota bacterium]